MFTSNPVTRASRDCKEKIVGTAKGFCSIPKPMISRCVGLDFLMIGDKLDHKLNAFPFSPQLFFLKASKQTWLRNEKYHQFFDEDKYLQWALARSLDSVWQ